MAQADGGVMSIEKATQMFRAWLRGFDLDASTLNRADVRWAIDYMARMRPELSRALYDFADGIVAVLCGPAQMMLFR